MSIFFNLMRKILLITLVAFFIALPRTGFCQGPKVAVFPFKNNGQAQLSGLSSGLSAMFMTDLSGMKGVEVIDPQKVDEALRGVRLSGGAPSTGDALKAAASLGADFALTGEYVGFGSRFRIDVRLYDVKTGTLKAADKAQNKEDAMFEMVDDLSGRLEAAITGVAPVAGGSLQVSSVPSGAILLLDGEEVGSTPKTITGLAPGQHKVEIDLDGYQKFTKSVTVQANDTAKVEAKLVRLFGGIRAWWRDMPTSDISISGAKIIPMGIFQSINMLSKYCTNLPSGHYVVTVVLPYKEESSWEQRQTSRTYSADMDIEPGQVMDIFINNNLFSPGIQITQCGECAADWDFITKMAWFEQ